MSLGLFNHAEPAGRPQQHRDGSRHRCLTRSRERHQTALRGPVGSAPADATAGPKPDAPETSPCRRCGHSKPAARPPKGDGLGRAFRRGNRDPRPAFLPPPTASAQFSLDSPAGPPRSTTPHAAASVSSGLLSSIRRSPVRGPIHADGVGRGPQHDSGGRASRGRRVNAVAVVPQFGV
jgi:hypothetical protein